MSDYEIEKGLLRTYKHICGIDEVGRGALFGPVVSGAVILNPSKLNYDIMDSKKLSPSKRVQLACFIYENALAFSMGWCWNDEIDELNIIVATKKSMLMALKRLPIVPDFALIDGMEPDFLPIEGQGIVRGDSKSMSIAAASIIAKVFRDHLLEGFARYFPDYHFEKNKGYPTKKHINMISLKGKTQFHRKSFGVNNG